MYVLSGQGIQEGTKIKILKAIIEEVTEEFLWFFKSDIELRTTTVSDLDGVTRIDGFYFRSKRPFSRSYQYHAVIGLENTYNILALIQSAIKERKRGVLLEIVGGMGRERIVIWKGSLKKAERLVMNMVKEIQKQY